MPPFLILGAVFILLKSSFTLQKFIFENYEGIKAIRRSRRDLQRAIASGKLTPEGEAKAREALAGLDIVVGVWDTAVDNAYDPTTREGQIEIGADLAALGFKVGALKLGIPILSRVVGALGTRFAVGETLTLALNATELVDFLTGKQTTKTFKEIVDAFEKANELLESGRRAGGPFLELSTEGTNVAFDIVELAVDVGQFATAPSVVGGVNMALSAVELAGSILGFLGRATGLLPEVKEAFKGPKPEVRVSGIERPVEVLAFVEGATPITPLTPAPTPVGITATPGQPFPGIIAPPPATGLPGFPAPPAAPPPPGVQPPPGAFPFFIPKLKELGMAARRFGEGITDIRRIVAELKRRA